MNLQVAKKNKEINYKGIKIYLDFTNSRLKIMDSLCISKEILEELKAYAANLKLGKIICNSRIQNTGIFKQSNFIKEGYISGFYNGEDAFCLSYFTDKQRETNKDKQIKDDIVSNCLKSQHKLAIGTYKDIKIRDAHKNDIPKIINLLKNIFETYPSPIFDKSYLENNMSTKTMYKVADFNGEIISIASADMDLNNKNAEITDCATNPNYRGKGLLTNIILHLEKSLKETDIKTLYSLSRAIEPGINKALCKMQYEYTGRLINNCDISGGFEDMNIWVKSL